MASHTEKGPSRSQQRSPSDGGVPSNQNDTRVCRARGRGLIVLQLLEMLFALIALSLGLVAHTEKLTNGWVFTLLGGVTLLVVPVGLILENTEVPKYTLWMKIGSDIVLFMLWAVVGPSTVPDPEVYAVANFQPKEAYFVTLMLLGAVEALLFLIQIFIRAHGIRMIQRQAGLADTSQDTHLFGNSQQFKSRQTKRTQGPKSSPKGKGEGKGEVRQANPAEASARMKDSNPQIEQPRNPIPPTQKCRIAHPPGHRLREFNPEGLYQRSLQKTYEPQQDVGYRQDEQQITKLQSQSSLASARLPTKPSQTQSSTAATGLIADLTASGRPTNSSEITSDSMQTLIKSPLHKPVDSIPKVRELMDPQESVEPFQTEANSLRIPLDALQKQITAPQIMIEAAGELAKPAQPIITPVNAQVGCGCVDGTEEMEIISRTDKPPVSQNGIHPLHMNPYSALRSSPLREVESASNEFHDEV